MTQSSPLTGPARRKSGLATVLGLLWRDKFAFCAALFLLVVIGCALIGPLLLEDAATRQNLRGRNAPPFDMTRDWAFFFGADALGRPLL
ncbi:MAG: ABC transporter permease, partial [Cereibacter changlensis]